MNLIRGTLKVRRLWTCRCCGGVEYGDAVTIELRGEVLADDAITRHWRTAPRTDFPVGWAGYGNEGAACPECIV